MVKQHPHVPNQGAHREEEPRAGSPAPKKPFKEPEVQECGSLASLTGERIFNFS